MNMHPGLWLGSLLLGLVAIDAPLVSAGQLHGQVPIHGVTGTIALPDNVDKFYSGLNKTLEKAGDGIDRLNGGKSTKVDSDRALLDRLRPGTAVVVHYTIKGIQTSADESGAIRDGVRLNEGVVTAVDRRREQITIRFADGSTESLRLTRHPPRGGRVIVYYPDESGQKVAHYFKPAT